MSLTLNLSQAAKSAGGDKYKIQDFNKESFIYVPQSISRASGSAALTLLLSFVSEPSNSIAFELVKQGKTGDDRYKSVNEAEWKGDIYLPHQYRNESGKVFIVIS